MLLRNTASEDSTARVWEAATSAPLGPPLRHSSMVSWPTFSADGRRAATVSHDESVRLWDPLTGELVGLPLEQWPPAVQVAFDRSGDLLLTLAVDGAVNLWDVSRAGGTARDWRVLAEVLCAHALSPAGGLLPLERAWQGARAIRLLEAE